MVFGDLGRLVLIAGEQPLVIADIGFQRRLIAEKRIEELQERDVLAEQHQADGQRRGEDETHRTPQPGPESDHHQGRGFRDTDPAPVEPWLDDHVADELQRQKEPHDQERCRPALGDEQAQPDWQQGREPRPEIGDVPKHRGEDSPRDGVGQSDEVQPDRQGRAVAAVDGELHQQIAADALAGFVERLGSDGQAPPADEADQPVTQVLAADEHEDHEDQRQRQAPQRRHKGGVRRPHFGDPGSPRTRHHGDRRRGCLLGLRRFPRRGWLRLGLLDLPGNLPHRSFELGEEARLAALQLGNPVPQVVLVLRKAVDQGVDFTRDDPADPADERERDDDRHGDGSHAAATRGGAGTSRWGSARTSAAPPAPTESAPAAASTTDRERSRRWRGGGTAGER